MKQKATVISTFGNIARVKAERASMCDGCHKKGCGGECGVYAVFGGDKNFVADAVNKIGAKEGDTVIIESPDSGVFLDAFLVFLLPIIISAAVYVFFSNFFSGNIPVISAAASFIFYFLCLALYESFSKKMKKTKIVIVSVENKTD